MRETISVPPDTQVNVPVRLPWVSLHSPDCDWLTQAKQVKPGLFAASTLLPNSDRFAAVRFINVSGTNHMLYRGLLLGDAEPGVAAPPILPTDVVESKNETGKNAGFLGNTAGPVPRPCCEKTAVGFSSAAARGGGLERVSDFDKQRETFRQGEPQGSGS